MHGPMVVHAREPFCRSPTRFDWKPVGHGCAQGTEMITRSSHSAPSVEIVWWHKVSTTPLPTTLPSSHGDTFSAPHRTYGPHP